MNNPFNHFTLSFIFPTGITSACLYLLMAASPAHAAELQLKFTLPELNVSPYHRPYVAAWLETPDRQHVTTILLWADDPQWHKDLRQWWRKAGRQNLDFDGITGATRRPKHYSITWDGHDLSNTQVPAGSYLLNIEVSREEGGRDYIRQKIEWPTPIQHTQANHKNEITHFSYAIIQ